MSRRLQIWNKTDKIYTLGEDENKKKVFTPAEWIAKYPLAEDNTVVISNSLYNGGRCEMLEDLVMIWERQGVDFSDCATDDEKLIKIEEAEDNMNEQAANYVSTEERTAAALEFIAVNSLPDT